MKKGLSLFLSLIMVLGILTSMPLTVNAASIVDLTFTLNEDGKSYSITGCNSDISGEIIIPDTYNGLPVTSIGEWAFGYCSNITSVTIGGNILSIGECAFQYCSNLISIIISYSVTSIGCQAFYDCEKLKLIKIPDSVISIGDYAFSYCDNLTSIDVDENNPNYSSLDGVLFNKEKTTLISYPNSKVGEIYIVPNSVLTICDDAFKNCENLSVITLSDNITSVGYDAFYNTGYYNDEANWENGVLYIGNHLIAVDNNSISEFYTVKEGTKTIAEEAFYYCWNIISITIPDSVTNIGDWAFSNCESLISINLSNNITTIGEGLFSNTLNLTSITIPDNVTSIGANAFYGCEGLTSINLPNNLTTIGEYAFESCNSLTTVRIPASVTNIDIGVFSACEKLSSINVDDKNETFSSVGGVLFNKNQTTLLNFPAGKKDVSYEIPNGVTNIGERAFRHCGKLNSVTIPDSVVNIADYAFTNTGLINVTIPDSVIEMGAGVFYGCLSLESVKLPNKIKNIEERTFSYCESLHTTIFPDNVTNIDIWAFYGCDALTTITIPDGVTSIGNSAFYDCKNLKSVTISKSVTFIDRYAFGYLKYEPTNPDFVINGFSGTVAETYAKENGFTFKVICKHTSTKWVTDKKATVNAAGKKHKECTACGEVLETAEIPQLKCGNPSIKVSNSGKNIKVSWSRVSGADYYYVYRKVSGGSYSYIGKTTKTSFTDEKASAGKTYIYKVRAKNEAGYSSYSSTKTVKHLDQPSIEAPTNTASGVKITWGKVTGASGYKVYRKTSSGWKYLGKTSKTYYTDKTAKSGKSYTYTVKAYSGDYNSSYNSTGVSKYYLADPTLKTPSSTKSGVKLTWSKVTGADGYMVYRKTGSGSYSKIATVKGNSKVTYTDKKAKKGKTYTYKIKAYKSKTYSAYSNTKTIKDKY